MSEKISHNDEWAGQAAGQQPDRSASRFGVRGVSQRSAVDGTSRCNSALAASLAPRPLGLVFAWLLLASIAWPLVTGAEEAQEPATARSEPAAASSDAEPQGQDEGNALDARLTALEQEAERLADSAAALSRNHAQLSEELAAMVSWLEQATASMAEQADFQLQTGRELRRQLAMLEAAALLNLGQQRAELAADVDGAVAAYRRANAVLADVDDARLDRVRRELARELDALESIGHPELGQIMVRLERLARESRRWPSQLDGRRPVEHQSATDAVDEAPDWRERLGGATRSLVRVQARDEVGRTSDQVDTARELMQLRLVAAQMALTRSDAEALALQLNAALELLDEWFDGTAGEVQQARRDLESIKSTELGLDLPELGEALNLLRTRLGEV